MLLAFYMDAYYKTSAKSLSEDFADLTVLLLVRGMLWYISRNNPSVTEGNGYNSLRILIVSGSPEKIFPMILAV